MRINRGQSPRLGLSLLATLALAVGFVVPAVSAAQADAACTITGTNAAETLTGTSGNDVICTNGGDDTVAGNGGADIVLVTGGGHVDVTLGSGNDRVDAAGADSVKVSSGAGNDTVFGSPGDDEITTGDGDDAASGGVGDDVIKGGAGKDTLAGGGDDDTVWGEVGADTLKGDAGDDIIAGGDGVDKLDGGFGLNNCDYTATEPRTATCVYDTSGPDIVSVTLDRSSLDSGGSDLNLKITVRVKDATGIGKVSWGCSGASGTGFGESVDFLRFRRVPEGYFQISGSDRDRTVTGPVPILEGAAPGKLNCHVTAWDVLGFPTAKGLRGVLTVTRETGVWDDDKPVFQSSSAPSQVDSSGSDADISIVASWQDASNLNAGGGTLCELGVSPGRTYYLTDHSKTVNSRRVGNLYVHTVTTRLKIPHGQYPGRYKCQTWAQDERRNSNTSILKDLVITRGGTDFDDSPPRLVSAIASAEIVDVGSSSAAFTYTLHFQDSAPIQYLNFGCSDESGRPVTTLYWCKGDKGSLNGVEFGDGVKPYVASVASMPEGLRTGTGTDTDATFVIPGTVMFGSLPGELKCGYNVSDGVNRDWYDIDSVPVSLIKILRTPPGLPQAPSGLGYTASNPTSGTLSWTAPEFPGDPALRDYQISYSADSRSWKTINDGFSTTTSLPISNLKPNTDYWFKVRGDNGGNSIPGSPGGTWSQVVKIRTPEATVPDQVSALASSLVSARSARASWRYGYNGGATITDFVAEVSGDNGVTWKTGAHKPSTAVTMTMSGLLPATHYTLRVRSKNAKGPSAASTTEFTTVNDVPDAAKNLRVTAKDSSSFSLAWDDPAANGAAVTDYRVEYSTNNGRTWVNVTHDPFVMSSATLSSLRSKATYLVRVTAINSVGVGRPSSPMTVITR